MGYAVNSVAVPRRAKEALGALVELEHPDGAVTLQTVPPAQLDALLREGFDGRGDVDDDGTGQSPFPGDTDQVGRRPRSPWQGGQGETSLTGDHWWSDF